MTAKIEQLTYQGDLRSSSEPNPARTLVAFEDPETGDIFDGWAEVAHEAVRAMNHLTSSYGRHPIPAPVAYSVLGNLAGIAYMLPQLTQQLAGGLEESLNSFDVYDNNGDPATSVALAGAELAQAGRLARELADALSAAQATIAQQGYNDPADAG